jgi:DNA-binding GntR family transcriptional regulator
MWSRRSRKFPSTLEEVKLRALCERLRVSRGTLREGLRQIEAEGLVRLVPNRGPVVAVLSERRPSAIPCGRC